MTTGSAPRLYVVLWKLGLGWLWLPWVRFKVTVARLMRWRSSRDPRSPML